MCALKVSLSTAKGKRMPDPGHHRPNGRSVRILRLVAALAIVSALVAIARIVKGAPAGPSHALVAAAIILGAAALLGMGLAAWPHIKKAKNDTRS